MSQHDYEITTEDANSGPSMRAAINEALQAVASNSLGATEPTTTYAGMWWLDTTAGVLKQRNDTDTAWVGWVSGINKNLLSNPEGLVNQEEYVDGAATTEKQHIFDMWGVDRVGTGACLEVTRLNKTIQLDNDVTSPAASWMQQENDDIHAVPDGNYLTLSGEVTAITGGDFAINGLGCNSTLTTTGTFAVTFAKDTSNTDAYDTPYLKYVVDAGEAVTVKKLKLEEGVVATAYSSPKITEAELSCYRYFLRIKAGSPHNTYISTSYIDTLVSQTTAMFSLQLPVPMSPITGVSSNGVANIKFQNYADQSFLSFSAIGLDNQSGFIVGLKGTVSNTGSKVGQVILNSGYHIDIDARYTL